MTKHWWIGLFFICCLSLGLSLLVATTLGTTAQLCFIPVQFLVGFVYGLLSIR